MKLLKIQQTSFYDTITHHVSDVRTARAYLNAWFLMACSAMNYEGRVYTPITRTVVLVDELGHGETPWTGRDGKDFENCCDDLDKAFFLFSHANEKHVKGVLNRFGMAPELKESYACSASRPEGLFGVALTYDRNGQERIARELHYVADFAHYTDGQQATKNLTGQEIETCVRQIEANCETVRWPSNFTIWAAVVNNRGAKVQK